MYLCVCVCLVELCLKCCLIAFEPQNNKTTQESCNSVTVSFEYNACAIIANLRLCCGWPGRSPNTWQCCAIGDPPFLGLAEAGDGRTGCSQANQFLLFAMMKIVSIPK